MIFTAKSSLAEEPRHTGGAFLIIEIIKIKENTKQQNILKNSV